MSETGLINREVERARLARLRRSGGAKLVLFSGRRRVGKTFLLNALWSPKEAFYFTASDTTDVQNRAALVAEFASWTAAPQQAADFPTWRTVFRLLLEHDAGKPLVIILDEFQYLGGDTAAGLAAVASELNAAWEGRRCRRGVLLVLAGSAVAMMEALDGAAAPLHGRFDWKHRLEPFDYWDAGSMVPHRALRDRAACYCVFGGMPRYLAAVDPARPLAENVANQLLAPDGTVRTLVETVLLQERGLRDPTPYAAILRAIADGRTDLNGIAQRAGLEEDTGLRFKIAKLVELGLIRQERNVGAGRTTAFRYRLADHALRFYQRFVAAIQATLVRQAPRDVWRQLIEPHFDSYLGLVFEGVAREAYFRHRSALDLPIVTEWGRWEGQDRSRQSIEVDIVARTADGAVMTGAVKWNRTPLEAQWYRRHEAMLERLSHSGVAWAHRALDPESPLLFLAAGGFDAGFRAAAGAARRRVLLWTLEDVYRGQRFKVS